MAATIRLSRWYIDKFVCALTNVLYLLDDNLVVNSYKTTYSLKHRVVNMPYLIKERDMVDTTIIIVFALAVIAIVAIVHDKDGVAKKATGDIIGNSENDKDLSDGRQLDVSSKPKKQRKSKKRKSRK